MNNYLVIGSKDDIPYASRLKRFFPRDSLSLYTKPVETLAELKPLIEVKNFKGILCTSAQMLARLTKEADVSVYTYAGSVYQLHGVEVVIVPELKYLVQVPYADFVFQKFADKLINKHKWLKVPEISWEVARPAHYRNYIEKFWDAKAISVDIETRGLLIKEVGICGLWQAADGKLTAHSIVFPFEAQEAYETVKEILANPAPKITQNGLYDNSHFLMYGIPMNNWMLDTFHLMHCWLAELPRDLGFIAALFVRNFQYWKEEKHSTNLHDKYFYNAKDTWVTLFACLQIMQELPDWAWTNYTRHEFKKLFPSIQMSMQGLKVDTTERDKLRATYEKLVDEALTRLRACLGIPEFNPNSPKQVVSLLQAFGGKSKFSSSDKKSLETFRDMHPLNSYIYDLITAVRQGRKLISTYIDAPLLNGRMLFSVNPGGTETGRAASKKSHFGFVTINTKGKPEWTNYGAQIQNQTPRIKSMYIADQDDDWLFAEVDNSQSESRCTAYMSEDPTLIDTVENSPDFHCSNASLFFGIPFDELFDITTKTVLNKPIRNLAKRTNHGANYNMGARVLLATMGLKNVLKAKHLLKLPSKYTSLDVCAFLLNSFDSTYPLIRGKWYDEIKAEITNTGLLVGPTGWTRRCFTDVNTKRGMNKYAAHGPQSLSVMCIDDAVFEVWRQHQILENRIRVIAQIHDSIFFMYRRGDEAVIQAVSEKMARPYTVRGRTMVIPNDPKYGAKRWAELKD